MTWATKKADARYRTKEHRDARQQLARRIKAGHGWCHQGLPGTDSSGRCLYPTRTIPPSTPSNGWHVGHNDHGDRIIGEVHAACNMRDAVTRGGYASHGRTPRPRPWQSRNW